MRAGDDIGVWTSECHVTLSPPQPRYLKHKQASLSALAPDRPDRPDAGIRQRDQLVSKRRII